MKEEWATPARIKAIRLKMPTGIPGYSDRMFDWLYDSMRELLDYIRLGLYVLSVWAYIFRRS